MFILVAIVMGGQETRPILAGTSAQLITQSSVQVASLQISTVPPGDIIREIDDPHTGDRWLLMRDDSHPGGPGILRLASGVRVEPKKSGQGAEMPLPVIRAGDRVIVEENTPVVEARLEAIALSQANAGSSFNLRLVLGGRVVRAIAVGPGRAMFQGENQQ